MGNNAVGNSCWHFNLQLNYLILVNYRQAGAIEIDSSQQIKFITRNIISLT
jgi:hypothetical protein